MDVTGTLLEANDEFLRLVNAPGPASLKVARYLVQPNFHDLVRSTNGQSGTIYEGLLTVTDVRGITRTLQARIWRDAAQILLIAEHDVADIERLTSVVLQLNTDSAQAHLQVVQAQMRLNQLNAELELRVGERTSALRAALDRVEAADRAKTAFLCTASHELRTPLNAIIGFSSLLLQGDGGDLSTEQRKQLDIIKRSGEGMLGLVSDILDAAILEAGDVRVDMRRVDVQLVLAELCAVARPSAQEAGLELIVPGRTKPLLVMADDARLRQVLGNLLSNAIKYTEAGTVTVRATAHGDKVRIEVEDTGIGIAIDHQANLFQPFARVVDRRERLRPGTGLGLSIARRLIEAMGGEIGVCSDLGHGSCFWCTLPVAPAAP